MFILFESALLYVCIEYTVCDKDLYECRIIVVLLLDSNGTAEKRVFLNQTRNNRMNKKLYTR